MANVEKLTRFREHFINSLSLKDAQEFNQALVDFVETKNLSQFASSLLGMREIPSKLLLLEALSDVLPDPFQEDFRAKMGLQSEEEVNRPRLPDDKDLDRFKGPRDVGSFPVSFLGTVSLGKTPTLSPGDMQLIASCLDNLAKERTAQAVFAPQHYAMCISPDDIRFGDLMTDIESSVSHLPMDSVILYSSMKTKYIDPEDIVAIVQKDNVYEIVNVSFYLCHPSTGTIICKCIKGAAGTAEQEKEETQGNPFTPRSQSTIPISGPLQARELNRKRLSNPSGLGAGQFGMVYLATYNGQDVNFKVAVKMLQLDSDEVNQEDFKTEAEIMLRLNHPNIVRIIGVCMREEPWLIVLEYIRYGALKKFLQTCKSSQLELSPREFCFMSRQLAAALAYVHEQGFVHMDIAARNVLVHHKLIIKLADFGQTRPVDADTREYTLDKVMRLSVRWMAPETLSNIVKVFSEVTDVWGYAVTCWEMFSYGRMPFKSLSTEEARDQIMAGRARLTSRPLPNCPEPMWNLFTRCWDYDASQRPRFTEITSILTEYENTLAEEFPEPRDLGLMLAHHK